MEHKFSFANALFTLASLIIVALLTIAHTRRISRQTLEETRKDWSDVAERRGEMNQALQDQVEALKGQLKDTNMILVEVRRENDLLRRRNLELQGDLDKIREEVRGLRAELRHAGVETEERR